MADDPAGDGLVGREPELGVLDGLLSRARAGQGRLVVVDGEPGIGKTALAHAFAHRARAAGVVTAWGACLEGEGASPYRPWAQILDGLGRPTVLHADVASRFAMFDEVVETLLERAEPQGLLVVLDDLHRADAASVLLVEVLAARLAESRVLVVGLTRRDEDLPDTDTWSGLSRGRATTRLTVAGLGSAAVADLVARTLGRVPDAALVAAVTRRAEGNPLFVVELARLAAVSGTGLPGEVRAVIGGRLDRLPAATREALGPAAVVGREFSVALLAAVAGRSPSRVRDLLRPAVVAGLVRDAGDGVLRFAHVLTQEVVYAEVAGAQLLALHRGVAAALGRRSEDDPDARAHHLRQAALLGGEQADLDAAFDATVAAAGRARDALAHEHAAFQFRQAAALRPQVATGPSRQALLVELARCEFRSGAVADAWRSCRSAVDLARGRGDPVAVADAALVVRGIRNDPLCAQVHALCRDALDGLGDRDPVRRARLLAQLAVTADPLTADRSADGAGPGPSERALLAAEACGDPDALFLALQARHAELLDVRCVHERLAVGERAVQLGRAVAVAEYELWGRAWRADAFWELSRRVQLDIEVAALAAVVDRLREPIMVWRLTMVRACLALHEGRFDEAAELADRALEIGRRGGHEAAEFVDVVFRANLAPPVGGDLTGVEAFVRRFAEHGPYLARFWLADIVVRTGRLDEARSLIASVGPHRAAFPRAAPEWIIMMSSLAETCVRLDDPATAAEIYPDLLPLADRQVTGGAHTPSAGPVALQLGRLARLLGDQATAEAHLGSAVALSAAMGSPPFEAEARVELARLLLARRRGPDVRHAEQHLRAALATAERLGMGPLAADARGLLGSRSRLAPLSAREDEVAALVATGASNRDIAARLHLSDRTVETHIRSIFHKLDVTSRTGIATWITARGGTAS